MSKKAYDTLYSVELGEITRQIHNYAMSGWRVHTFVHIPEPSHLPSHWVALMERDCEE